MSVSMDAPTCPSEDTLALQASSSLSSEAVSTPSLRADPEWRKIETQHCLECRIAGDSYAEISEQLVRLRWPYRSISSIMSKLKELETCDQATLEGHLNGFNWKQTDSTTEDEWNEIVAEVRVHLEERRIAETSTSPKKEAKKQVPRTRKRVRNSSPPPPASTSLPKRARTSARKIAPPPTPEIEHETSDEDSNVDDSEFEEETSPLTLEDHASRAVSPLTAPLPALAPATPRTWRSIGKQRELRPLIREQQMPGKPYYDFTLFDRTDDGENFDPYAMPGETLLPLRNPAEVTADQSGNGDAHDGVNWADYVSEDVAWWLPSRELFIGMQ
jgi:hypothetical protein